jgi:hypothetical protein
MDSGCGAELEMEEVLVAELGQAIDSAESGVDPVVEDSTAHSEWP